MSERNIWEELAAPFPDSELEWKPQTMGKKNGKIYALLVPYVQSRAIMERLDGVLTPAGWMSEFRPVVIKDSDGFICRLSIRDPETMEWVYKEDGAPASDIESLKGAISGALKRAAVQVGIGRDLYGLPKFWAENIQEGRPPADVTDAVRLYKKDEIDAWCHAPKIGVTTTPPITRTPVQRAAKAPTPTEPPMGEPDVPDYSDIPPGEPPPSIDETPHKAKQPAPTGSVIGRQVRDMESKLDGSTCFFCGERHIKKGDTIICVEDIPGRKKGQWGDPTCYANWCVQQEASNAA